MPWWVANCCTHRTFRYANETDKPAPIDYDALTTCCEKLARIAVANGAHVHLPRIGGGLAGGDWHGRIVPILLATLGASGLPVTIYLRPSDVTPEDREGLTALGAG